jgi:2,5-dihydroxypyridine 5,6-dioxygenase
MATEYEMIGLFKDELELCAVKPHETVIVFTEGETRADYARAFLIAARELGASTFQVGVLPRSVRDSKNHTGQTPITGNRAVVEALKGADMVIDLVGLLFSPEQSEITASGARMLMVREPFEILRQMFPDRDLRRRVEYGEQLLAKGRTMHITSPGGTDVTYILGDYPVLTQYGYVDTPGRWDHFATGQVLSQACDGQVNGRIVIMPGDLITDFRRYIESPVTLDIEGGYVRRISGAGMDAELLRDYMYSFDDPRAFAISHIGWGLHRQAKWFHNAVTRTRDAEVGVNSLSFYGNVLFSTGPNTELGGNNDTPCHIDVPLRNATLVLDGLTVVKDGDIVVPEMRAS